MFVAIKLGQEKKCWVSANPTDPILWPDPTDFIGKFVYTELEGQYKTVKPPSWDCKNAGHWTILIRPYKGW